MAGDNAKEILKQAQDNGARLAQANKKLMSSFMGSFAPAVLGDGALSHREKELIALGMAIVTQCEYCIVVHLNKCLEAGITREEIAEVCGVATLMGGGPSLMYSGRTMELLEQLLAD